MDDTRPLDGMTGQSGGGRQVERSEPSENDLEDNGNAPYRGTARRRRRQTDIDRSPPERHHPIGDEDPPPELVQELDRMRTTGDAGHGTDTLRRLRGQKHYKEDPSTAFHRRLGEAEHLARHARQHGAEDGGSALEGLSGALERKPPSEPGDALEPKQSDD